MYSPDRHVTVDASWQPVEAKQFIDACDSARQETVVGLSESISFNNKDDYLHGLLIAELDFQVAIHRLEPSVDNTNTSVC